MALNITVQHSTLTGRAANPLAIIDGPKWDAQHSVSISGTFAVGDYGLSASALNALTGDITTTLGSAVTTLASTIPGAKTWSGPQAISDATASAGVNSGALIVVGGIGTQGDLHSKSLNPHVAPNTAWGIDFSPAGQITVPGGGSYTLATGSGLVMMTDSAVTGQTGLYLIGGSATASAVKIAGGSHYDNPTVTPSANNYSVGYDGTHWNIYNGNASAVTFFVGLIRCRNTN